MSGGKKKSKTLTIAPTNEEVNPQSTEAFRLHSQGLSYDQIADQLGVTPWVARELTSLGYVVLGTQQAEELRATIEVRLDDVIRRLYQDLATAANQVTRNSIYALILKSDAQRAKLLGLEIPPDTPDDTLTGGSPRA